MDIVQKRFDELGVEADRLARLVGGRQPDGTIIANAYTGNALTRVGGSGC